MTTTVLPFTQPHVLGDVDVYLDTAAGLLQEQNLLLEKTGSYIVKFIDYSSGKVLLRRYGASDDKPTGTIIPAHVKVLASSPFVQTRQTSNIDPSTTHSSQVLAMGDVGVMSTAGFVDEKLKELKKKIEDLEAKAEMVKKKGVEASMGRTGNKGRQPWLIRAEGAQQVQELSENLQGLTGLELLDKVNSALALYYDEDPTVPGVVTASLSCFPGDEQLRYASIVRYRAPAGQEKYVVAWAKAATLEGAIRSAIKVWLDDMTAERMKRQMDGEVPDEGEDLEKKLVGSIERKIAEIQKKKEDALFPVPRLGDTVTLTAPGGEPKIVGTVTPLEAFINGSETVKV